MIRLALACVLMGCLSGCITLPKTFKNPMTVAFKPCDRDMRIAERDLGVGAVYKRGKTIYRPESGALCKGF